MHKCSFFAKRRNVLAGTILITVSCLPSKILLGDVQELSAPSAMVKRDGQWNEVDIRELVPGDLIDLKGGDVVPADAMVRLEAR